MADLLRVGEAARRLGVHPSTIRDWCDRGRLPYVRLPSGERRVPVSAIEAILTPVREGERDAND